LTSEAPPVLELRGIDKSYRRRPVLNGLNLQVQRGEIVGLLGPNGSGKTTTLRIAAGYLWPNAGQVAVNGQALTPNRPHSRAQVGYLPERVPLYDPFKVERYLMFVAAARGLTGTLRSAAVNRVLGALDLDNVRQRIIGQLSKGYRQRIGLAQALLGAPEVLLLDEPTNGLDPFQIIEARNFIRAAAQDRAVIFSTHIMQEVEALCTRVVYLADGALTNLSAAPDARATTIIEARIVSDNLDTVLAAVTAFDAAITTRVETLGKQRFCLRCSAPIAQRSGLARVLANCSELEAFAPPALEIEQRLVAAIDSAAHGQAS
jgi:ABC-2 type transport system ATP-binding protein